MSQLDTAISRFVADEGLAHGIINGPATGPASTVGTEGGPVRTLAKVVADAQASSDAAAAIQRASIQSSANVVLNGLGYAPPVAYAAGISLTTTVQTVSYNGLAYAPNAADLPFTTSGTFETAKFRLIVGVAEADLRVSDYAALRASTSPSPQIFVTGYRSAGGPLGVTGPLELDPTDTTSVDDDIAVIARADGKRYKRTEGYIDSAWAGAVPGLGTSAATATTAALLKAFNAATKAGKELRLRPGVYTINGPVCQGFSLAAGGFFLSLNGDVTLEVDPTAPLFGEVIIAEWTNPANLIVSGPGSLLINCNNRAQAGFWAGHYGGAALTYDNPADVCDISNISVTNAYGHGGGSARGVFIRGPYRRHTLTRVEGDGMTRSTNATGECTGIAVIGIKGLVTLTNCAGRRAVNALQDADGIKVFGVSKAGVNSTRLGKVVSINCEFEDNSGRSFKSQVTDTVVISPRVIRAAQACITQAVEFDFQFGGGAVIDPEIDYKKLSGGASPLGSSHSIIAFQHALDDVKTHSVARGGHIRTEVQIPRHCLVTTTAANPGSSVLIDSPKFHAVGTLDDGVTSVFSRALCEINMSQVEAMAAGKVLAIVVRGANGPMPTPVIGYTVATATGAAAKFRFEVIGNVSTIGTAGRAFSSLSGVAITTINKYRIKDNSGISDYMAAGWVVDMTNGAMMGGNEITVDLASAVFTNGPAALPTSGTAKVTVENASATAWAPREIKVNNLTVANSWFYSLSGTWGTLK